MPSAVASGASRSHPCRALDHSPAVGGYKANKPDLKGIVTDENRYKNYLQDFAGRTPEEIGTHDVDALRLRLAKAGKKAGTVKNVLELLRRIINFGVKKGLCPWQSPAQLHFEMPRLNNVKTELPTAEQRARFIEAARNARNRKAGQFMLMAYYTGMRRGERASGLRKFSSTPWRERMFCLCNASTAGAWSVFRSSRP